MSMISAYDLLKGALIHYRGQPVGTSATVEPTPAALNYHACFIRDFVPAALVWLMSGEAQVVRDFLVTVMHLHGQQPVLEGRKRSVGLLSASSRVVRVGDEERLQADFGERAMGRMVPVDSAMWWMFLLRAHEIFENPGARTLFERFTFQTAASS